jgi:hypothetical protein
MDAYGVFYRRDLFKKAGVTANWKTWPQLLATAKKLEGKLPAGVAPVAFAFGAPEQVPAIFVGAYKGNYLNDKGKWEVEPGPATKALELTQEILKLGPKGALGLSIDEANAQFLQGNAAILIGWPSFVRAALNDPKQSKLGKNWALAYFPGLSRLRPESPRLARYMAGHLSPDQASPVDAVNGAFMLVRREALAQVGPLDEDFWLYMEDLDWCYRFWEAGWPVLYWPGAEVVHVKGGSATKNRSWRANHAFHRGMWLFYRKHYLANRSPVVSGLVWLAVWGKLGMSAARSLVARRAGT